MELGIAVPQHSDTLDRLPFALSSSSSTFSRPFFSLTKLRTPLIGSLSIRGGVRGHQPLAVSASNVSALVAEEAAKGSAGKDDQKGRVLRLDKYGRFSSPRAARELSLLILCASCLEGSDPVRLFDKRINGKREPTFMFDESCLLEYDHMGFGGEPLVVQTEEEEQELLLMFRKESLNEEEVLSAPPKLVYSKNVLRFGKRILEAVLERWDCHVQILDKVTPPSWKNEPGGRILELCILHIAMAEISMLDTRYQIVINESVDLAKRFCDGSAPRIINGCLRTFIKEHMGTQPSVQGPCS